MFILNGIVQSSFIPVLENDLTYKQLVNHLYPLKTKWDIHIIDIFNNDEINKLAKSDKEMMVDDSHPTKKVTVIYIHLF